MTPERIAELRQFFKTDAYADDVVRELLAALEVSEMGRRRLLAAATRLATCEHAERSVTGWCARCGSLGFRRGPRNVGPQTFEPTDDLRPSGLAVLAAVLEQVMA